MQSLLHPSWSLAGTRRNISMHISPSAQVNDQPETKHGSTDSQAVDVHPQTFFLSI